ncbi:MAG TPA: ABC transporter ATP-binding protein [Roseiflexaceae bacterium]|nr:ABC transporter ATP-binding protein [Roseiflexaceae bacterium]
MDYAIRVTQLSKQYQIGGPRAPYRTLRDTLAEAVRAPLLRLRGRPAASSSSFWALRDVSFDVPQGEVVGIIGRNGAGKSTLLKVLARITAPTAGRAELRGRVGTLLEVGTGFHPELTGRENVYLNGAILGMRREEIVRKFDEIVAFAEVEQFIDTPVKHYSSGMYLRLAFAVAAHLEPEILIVDEVLAVGDAAFQKKCLGKMGDVAREGRTVLFVSHNMQAVRQLCRHAILLRQGQIAFSGAPGQAILEYFGGNAAREALIDLSDLDRRSGSNGGLLRSVQFLDGGGRPVYELSRHDQLRVAVRFGLQRPVGRADLAMAVIHGDGTPVFSESLSDQTPPGALPPGEYECEFAVDMRYLKPEPYFLTLYLTDGGRTLDHVDAVTLPEVTDPEADSIKESHRWGVARVPVRWTELRSVTDA